MIQTFKKGALIATSILTLAGALLSCGGNGNEKKDGTAAKSMVEDPNAELNKDEKLAKGKEVYTRVCQACHQPQGQGIPGAFPPLAGSDYLKVDINRAIHGAANGLNGEIMVNGVKYNLIMPKPIPAFTDQELASVFTYVLNNFGNAGGEVTNAQAAAARK